MGGVPADLGLPDLPGCKSHTQRAMVLAGFLPGRRLLRGALRSADPELLGVALERLGARVEWQAEGCRIQGVAAAPRPAELFLGENATALRMLLLVVPLLGGSLVVDGAPGLRARPLGAVLATLHALGLRTEGEGLPLRIAGPARSIPSVLDVEASGTSQAASGAVLGMALRSLRVGGTGRVRALRPAAPGYLAMTGSVLRGFGCEVHSWWVGPDLQIEVGPWGPIPEEFAIPPDASSATFVRVLAALHRRAAVPFVGPTGNPHPEAAVGEDLAALQGAAPHASVVLDRLGLRPDAFPALAALAATRSGETLLTGAASLRAKESDRIAAMAMALHALGVECQELTDGLWVRGPLRADGNEPVPVPAPADHRVIMALALLGTVLPQGVSLPHRDAVAKSWPGFWEWLARVAEVT